MAQRVDILQIYNIFVASNTAAKHCSPPDEATKAKFASSFATVSLRAAMAFKQRNPGKSDPELIAAFDKQTENVVSVIEREIKTNGCTSPTTQQMLKLYKINVDFKVQ